jgi:F-type H+-transporting ATPase subunit b
MEALGISGLALLAQIVNFVIILFLLNRLAVGPITRILAERRARIDQGLKDAEQARADRENAEQERVDTLAGARREATEILARAQKVAQETRDTDIAATRAELERLRDRATEEIEAEKSRALAELRGEVTNLALAAAGKVVGETMPGERQRRLVEEFLAGSGADGGAAR